mgnify:CR=1 FL=1
MDVEGSARRLANYLDSLPDFTVAKTIDGNYGHMGATITDGILQAGINYESVVRPRVNRLRAEYPEAVTTSGFLTLIERVGLEEIIEWKPGAKPERILGVTRFFQKEGIETEGGLREWLEHKNNRKRFLKLNGIGEKTADYFGILVGVPAAAIDRHLIDFLRRAGIEVQGYTEAKQIIEAAADLLGIHRSFLDHSIWRYISSGKKMDKKSTRTCPQTVTT